MHVLWPQVEFLDIVKFKLFLLGIVKLGHFYGTGLMVRVVCVVAHHVVCLVLLDNFLSVAVACGTCRQNFNDCFIAIVLTDTLLGGIKFFCFSPYELVKTIVVFFIIGVFLGQTFVLNGLDTQVDDNSDAYRGDHTSDRDSHYYHNYWCIWLRFWRLRDPSVRILIKERKLNSCEGITD